MFKKAILNSPFFKNVLKVSSGTFIAQIIMLLGMLIITRLYSKEEIGIYALFISSIGITTSFVTLAYDNTIVLPKKNRDASTLLKISLFFASIFSFIIFITLNLPFDFFYEYTEISLFIALGTFFQVCVNSLSYFKIRYNLYGQLSKSKIVRNLFLILFQAILFYISGIDGLLLGYIAAAIVTILYLLYKDKYIKVGLFNNQGKEEFYKNLKKYKAYPKYFCWSNLIFALSSGLPILIFNEYFSIDKIAIYSIAASIIIQPAGLISSSIRPVLLSRFAEKINNSESIKSLYNKIFLYLSIAGVIISVGIYILLPSIVTLIFGSSWAKSGELTRILIPIFVWYFISIPSSICSKVYPFQKYTLFYTILSLIFKIGSIIFAIKAQIEFDYVIFIYALTTLISSLANHLIVNYKINKHENLTKMSL